MYLLRVIFSLLFWLWIAVSSILIFPVNFLIWLLHDRKDPRRLLVNKVSCFWASLYLWCNPCWRVEITGKEKIDPDKTVLFICNHQSSFDTYLLFRLFVPFQWVSKKSNFRIPIIGWNMRLMRTIGFERGDRRETLMMVKECVHRLQEGVSLVIFPEGERTPDGRLRPFLKGAFAIAKRAHVPIQPMVLNGTYHILPRYHFIVNLSGRMTLKVLDPIPLEVVEEKTAEELSEMAWRMMVEVLPPEARPLEEEKTGIRIPEDTPAMVS